jgi:hypothetical protein
MVHTFNGELFSTSSTSSFHSTIPKASATILDSNTASIQTEFGLVVQLIHHLNGKKTSLGRVGPFLTLNILEEEDNTSASSLPPLLMDIVIKIPQKFNVSCFVSRGDFIVGGGKHDGNNNNYYEDDGKLEGDVHLRTSSGGNIVLHGKVRGHDVTLESLHGVGGFSGNDSEGFEARRGLIHVCKSIEAGKVRIHSNSPSGRVRARMLKVGSSLSIDVLSSSSLVPPLPTDPSLTVSTKKNMCATTAKLDDDDGGAVIDIGSVYIVSNGGGMDDNETRLNVTVDDGVHTNGLVRVKSSHGHIAVRAIDGRIPSPLVQSTTEKKRAPLIDLGGVNGSCDVMLDATCSSSFGLRGDDNRDGNIGLATRNNNTPCHNHPDLRVHFDSMSPESISTITSRKRGGVRDRGDMLMNSVTMDRKLEADVRLLTVEALHDHCVDAHSLTQSDDIESIQHTLMDIANLCKKNHDIDNNDKSQNQPSIIIESNAYVDGWYNKSNVPCDNEMGANIQSKDDERQRTLEYFSCRGIEYAHGSMTNRSGEPDSRFDVRTSFRRHDGGVGDSEGGLGGGRGGGGKINIQGAALQALHGFRRQETDSIVASTASTSTTAPMPLLSVVSDGIIKLETLSWFGSIARRYGLEESKDGEAIIGGVGRQASRSPRLEK